MADYIPILLFAAIALGFGAVSLVLSVVLGRAGRRSDRKDSPYECGVPSEPGVAPRFSVKFYLVAMLFILFDIEIVFMYPWAVVFRDYIAQQGTMILWSMLGFVLILLVGYVYALRKGAFDWSK